jgi:hypothetical protein
MIEMIPESDLNHEAQRIRSELVERYLNQENPSRTRYEPFGMREAENLEIVVSRFRDKETAIRELWSRARSICYESALEEISRQDRLKRECDSNPGKWARLADDNGHWLVGKIEPFEFQRRSSCRVLTVSSNRVKFMDIDHVRLSSISDVSIDNLSQYIADVSELVLIAAQCNTSPNMTAVRQFLGEKHRSAVDRRYPLSLFGDVNDKLLETLIEQNKSRAQLVYHLWRRASSFELTPNLNSFAAKRRLYLTGK